MSKVKAPISLQIQAASRGFLYVFRQPLFSMIAIFAALLTSAVVLWSLNIELIGYIMFSAPLPFADKIEFFVSIYRDIFIVYQTTQAIGIMIFSAFFGVNLAMLLFVASRRGFSDLPKKSGFFSLLVAIIGGGCAACGTSLLAPLLTTFGIVSSAAVLKFSAYLMWIGTVFVLYSIFKLSLLAVRIKITNK